MLLNGKSSYSSSNIFSVDKGYAITFANVYRNRQTWHEK